MRSGKGAPPPTLDAADDESPDTDPNIADCCIGDVAPPMKPLAAVPILVRDAIPGDGAPDLIVDGRGGDAIPGDDSPDLIVDGRGGDAAVFLFVCGDAVAWRPSFTCCWPPILFSGDEVPWYVGGDATWLMLSCCCPSNLFNDAGDVASFIGATGRSIPVNGRFDKSSNEKAGDSDDGPAATGQ